MIKIRPALIGDVRSMHRLLNSFAERKELLPRSISELYDSLQKFYVAEHKGKLVGCCSLSVVWDNLAEVKALAVDESYQGRGLGRQLLEACMKEAKRRGITRLFALTMKDSFFKKFGFQTVPKNHLPHKVWTECVQCPYFPDTCVEIAMVRDLDGTPPTPAFSRAELPQDGTVPVEPAAFHKSLKEAALPPSKKPRIRR